jgi:SRSO17 transposase
MLRDLQPCSPFSYLNSLHRKIGPRFARAEPRERVLVYLRGLLSPVQRRNGWQLAAQGGEKYPDGMQRLLNSAHWNVDRVRDDVRDFVLGHAAARDSVIIFDQLHFQKRGNHSVGVHRRRVDRGRRIENVQIGLFLTYASGRGRFLIDRELFLPGSWVNDLSRRQVARVPKHVTFRSTAELAAAMVARAFAAEVPARWVGASVASATDHRLRTFLERSRRCYVLGLKSTERLPLVTETGVASYSVRAAKALVPPDGWVSQPRKIDSPRPRQRHVWARLPLPAAQPGRTTHWLLMRKNAVTGEDLVGYLCRAVPTTPLSELVDVATLVETNGEVLSMACDKAGLDEYEVRHWIGWYRYTTLAMAAYNCLALAASNYTAADVPAAFAKNLRPRRRPSLPLRTSDRAARDSRLSLCPPPPSQEERPCPTLTVPMPRRPSALSELCASKCADIST